MEQRSWSQTSTTLRILAAAPLAGFRGGQVRGGGNAEGSAVLLNLAGRGRPGGGVSAADLPAHDCSRHAGHNR